MSKVVLLSRVSTQIQELDSQTQKLREAALYEGYAPEDFIIIEDKESGVKLTEEERNGLNQLKEAVINDGAKHVIVFELSRLSRRPDTIYSIRDFLIKNGVQLQVLNPSFKLLKADGTLDENANILLGIFCSMAENEGLLRKSRFKRGKAKLFAQNRYCGGGTAYGYYMDKDYNFLINEAEAEVVRYIFAEFISGKRTEDIGRTLIMNGTWPEFKLTTARNKVRHILHNCVYIGERSNKNEYANVHVKYGYSYPPIITKETYDEAAKASEHRAKYNKIRTKHTYLCRGLIYTQDRQPFNVHYSHDCYARQIVKDGVITDFNLRISMIDGFVWDLAKRLRLTRPDKPVDTVKAELESKIKELEFNLASVDGEIEQRNEKIRRIEMRYLNGKITESDADRLQETARSELASLNENRSTICLHIQALKGKIDVLLSDDDKASETALNLLTDEEKAVIVKQEIKQIIAVKVGPGKATLGILTNESDDVALYSYVSRDKTITPINF